MESEAQRKRREAHDATSRWCPADCPHCARARAAIDAALDACAKEARLEGEGTACYHNDEEEWKLQARNFLLDHGIECERGACEDILGQWAIAVERRIAARAEARKGGGE